MKTPKVSIICTAYNHRDFIRAALDGFIMQKTDFPFEVIVHDDASTDDTADIIREYAEKYPDIIKPIFQTENQFSRGVKVAKKYMWPLIRGKYVAVNEGDDYWTDPYKLQKQVDFLEAHPDYSVCFHPVRVVWQNGSQPDSVFPTPDFRFNKTSFDLSDLIKYNFIQTNSVMYRWRKDCVDIFPDGILPGDWYLHLLHAQVGKIGFLDEVMSVYRKHAGGIWYESSTMSDSFVLKNCIPCLRFYKCMENQFNCDKSDDKLLFITNMIGAALRNKRFDILQQVSDMEANLFDKATTKHNEKSTEHFVKYKKYKRLFNFMLILSSIELLIILLLFWRVVLM